MAMNYGRAGAMKSQRGPASSGYASFKPTDVASRLMGSELEEYQSALKTLAGPAQLKKSGALKEDYLRGQEAAMDTASRLRELAASRAFTDFSQTAMQYSKPWLMQSPSEGLITEETVPYGLAKKAPFSLSFAGEGVQAAPPSSALLMGTHTFSPISYKTAAQIKKGKRLSEIPSQYSFASPTNPSYPQIDFGNLSNLNFGGY